VLRQMSWQMRQPDLGGANPPYGKSIPTTSWRLDRWFKNWTGGLNVFDPCATNLGDQELAQLAEFLRGWKVDEDAIEYGVQVLFGAGQYELAKGTREKLVKMLSRAAMSFSRQFQ